MKLIQLQTQNALYGPSRQPFKTHGQSWRNISYKGKVVQRCGSVGEGSPYPGSAQLSVTMESWAEPGYEAR